MNWACAAARFSDAMSGPSRSALRPRFASSAICSACFIDSGSTGPCGAAAVCGHRRRLLREGHGRHQGQVCGDDRSHDTSLKFEIRGVRHHRQSLRGIRFRIRLILRGQECCSRVVLASGTALSRIAEARRINPPYLPPIPQPPMRMQTMRRLATLIALVFACACGTGPHPWLLAEQAARPPAARLDSPRNHDPHRGFDHARTRACGICADGSEMVQGIRRRSTSPGRKPVRSG